MLVLELTKFNSSLIVKRNSEGPPGKTDKWPDGGCKSDEGFLVSTELAQPLPKTKSCLSEFFMMLVVRLNHHNCFCKFKHMNISVGSR